MLIAATTLLTVCSVGGCGGRVLDEQVALEAGGSGGGVGGSGHDASQAGSGGAGAAAGSGASAGTGGSNTFDGCPGLGCAPNCGDAGVVLDENGCPTCSCNPLPEGGTGGSSGGPGCGLCGPLEQCFDNKLCVAEQVSLPGGYAIDATEVTRDQYAAWLATSPSTAGQDTWCSWNAAFDPGLSCMNAAVVCKGDSCGNHPQVCVDWCDAYAYCKAVGKRLCGKIGSGANPFEDYKKATQSQWFSACSSNKMLSYPYGNAYIENACNGATDECNYFGTCTTVPVGSLSGCQSSVSGYEGVYDLSGNASEWEDSCNGATGEHDDCRVRGGSFRDSQTMLFCGTAPYYERGWGLNRTGIRCCSP